MTPEQKAPLLSALYTLKSFLYSSIEDYAVNNKDIRAIDLTTIERNLISIEKQLKRL